MNAVRPLRRVVRAEELGLYRDAAGALAAARIAADQRIAEARAQADALRTEAHRQGLAAAQAEAVRMMAAATAHLQHQLQDLRLAIAATIADGVAAVIGELHGDQRIILAASRAVARLQDRTRLSVRVASGQADAVRQALASDVISVIEDATLSTDDCVIDTEAGFARAGITLQLAALREALLAAA